MDSGIEKTLGANSNGGTESPLATSQTLKTGDWIHTDIIQAITEAGIGIKPAITPETPNIADNCARLLNPDLWLERHASTNAEFLSQDPGDRFDANLALIQKQLNELLNSPNNQVTPILDAEISGDGKNKEIFDQLFKVINNLDPYTFARLINHRSFQNIEPYSADWIEAVYTVGAYTIDRYLTRPAEALEENEIPDGVNKIDSNNRLVPTEPSPDSQAKHEAYDRLDDQRKAYLNSPLSR